MDQMVTAVGAIGLALFIWSVQRHLTTSQANTIQLAILGEQIKSLTDALNKLNDRVQKVDKLELDVRVAHSRIKALQEQVKN